MSPLPRFLHAVARCSLYLDYAARVLWAPLGILALSAAIVAMDVLPRLNPWLHAGIITALAIAFAAALRRGFTKNTRPTRPIILRRLERDSGIAHRPYDAIEDRAAGLDRASPLWKAHQDWAAQALQRIRPSWPRSRGLAACLSALLLIGAIAIGCDDFPDRLDAALSPGVLGATPASAIGFEAWITPPDYTGLPPIVLARGDKSGDTIEVPLGSTIEAHVTGGSARPHIVIDGKRQKFAAIDQTSYQLSLALNGGSAISITQGWRTLGKWQVSLSEIVGPVVEWVKPPAAADHAQVKFEYTAADQYGLASLTATTRLADEVRATMLPAGSALENPAAGEFTVPLSDVSGHPKSIKSSTLEDWTSNPWAGFPVTVTLTATGTSGKSATTKPQPLVLPERSFTNPVARAIIAERKKLTLDPVQQRIPVATALAELAGHHELYHDDVTVFLVLRTAAARLWKDDRFTQLRDIQSLLWQAAVRLEDGSSGEASKAIADAAKALREALKNGAPQSQIDRLTQALKQAMNQYLDQLQKDLQQRLARGEKIPMLPDMGRMMDRKSLDDMVDRMNGLSQSGNRDAANEALNQIESMMRNLRMAQKMQPGSKAMQAWNAMKQLRDLAEKQQQLNDDTFRRSRGETTQGDEMQSLNNGRSSDPTKRHQNQAENNGAQQQQQLQNSLQGLQQQLGKLGAQVPGSLNESQQQMGDAAGKLGHNDFGGALPSQQQALNKLREGLQILTDQMNKNGEGGFALGGDKGGQEEKEGNAQDDPFGREGGKAQNDQTVKIPDEDSQQKSRAILEELRKRSGERFRSHDERDYIDRLLKDY
jgi:uncharacterized protein (TIGR02302 family)